MSDIFYTTPDGETDDVELWRVLLDEPDIPDRNPEDDFHLREYTPEERSEIARRAWVTRNRNARKRAKGGGAASPTPPPTPPPPPAVRSKGRFGDRRDGPSDASPTPEARPTPTPAPPPALKPGHNVTAYNDVSHAEHIESVLRLPKARDLTEAMIAGVPGSYRIAVRSDALRVGAVGTDPVPHVMVDFKGDDGTAMTRTFRRDQSGNLIVHHDLFTVPESKQGQGIGKAFLKSSFDEYKKLGVKQVEVFANIDVGGYAWAKFGFKPDSPGSTNQRIDYWIGSSRLPDADKEVLRKALNEGPPETAIWRVADAKVGRRKPGKKLLAKSSHSWDGHINLDDTEAMARLTKYLTGKKPRRARTPKPKPAEVPVPVAASERTDLQHGELFTVKDGRRQDRDLWAELLDEDLHEIGDNEDYYDDSTDDSTDLMSLDGLTPDERSEIARRAWDTRGRNEGQNIRSVDAEKVTPDVVAHVIGPGTDVQNLVGDMIAGVPGHFAIEARTTGTTMTEDQLANEFWQVLDQYDEAGPRPNETADARARRLGVPGMDNWKRTVYGGKPSLRVVGKSGGTEFERTFRRDFDGNLIVHHDFFAVDEKNQGAGVGTALLKSSFDTYEKIGVKTVELDANIDVGAYAWAKFGFKPDVPEHFNARMLTWINQKEEWSLTDRKAALDTLYTGDPETAVWRIADLQVGDRKLGKELLTGRGHSWQGHLHLDDAVAMKRLHAYLNRPTKTTTAVAASVRQTQMEDARKFTGEFFYVKNGEQHDAALWADVLGEDAAPTALSYREKLRALVERRTEADPVTLTPQAIADGLAGTDWQVGREGITKRFTFPNRRASAAFTSTLFEYCNTINHHPDVVVDGDSVTVTYITHATNTITELDIEGAHTADRIAASTPPLNLALFDVSGAEHKGLLVSLTVPTDVADALADLGVEEDDLHITLTYSGNVEELGDIAVARALIAVADIARMSRPLDGHVGALDRFEATEFSDNKDVIIARVDMPSLEPFRQRVEDALNTAGAPPKTNHEYTPHITLAYVDVGAPPPVDDIPALPMHIDHVTVSVGDLRSDLPLGAAHDLSAMIMAVLMLDTDRSEVARRAWDTRGRGQKDPATVKREAGEFLNRFEQAFANSPYSAFVTHYTPEQVAEGRMTPLLSNEGKTGMLVHDHGDGRIEGTALFNTANVKGAGLALLKEAIEKHGVNYAECYGPYLPALYKTLGFETESAFDFDPTLADPKWDRAKFDEPKYHIMRLKNAPTVQQHADQRLSDLRREVEATLDPAWVKAHGDVSWAAALALIGEPDDSVELDLDSEAARKAWDTRGRGRLQGQTKDRAEPTSSNPKVARALKSHKPATKEKQQWAEKNETVVVQMVGGDTTGDNKPTDVNINVGNVIHGVEVKTLLDNQHDKITMHPSSRQRKLAWAKTNHAKLHTVVIDDRDKFGGANWSGHRMYYREGVGSFTIQSMIKVTDPIHLKQLMGV